MSGSPLLLALALMQNPAPPPQADLTLSVGCGTKPNEVILTILNPSDGDTAVLLGYALDNGRSYLPRELVVEIKQGGNSDFEELLYYHPVTIVGRLDHWVVTLPAGARFTLMLHTVDFASLTPRYIPLAAPPEELRVRLTGRPVAADLNPNMTGMKRWRVWTGTALSNSLRVAAECVR